MKFNLLISKIIFIISLVQSIRNIKPVNFKQTNTKFSVKNTIVVMPGINIMNLGYNPLSGQPFPVQQQYPLQDLTQTKNQTSNGQQFKIPDQCIMSLGLYCGTNYKSSDFTRNTRNNIMINEHKSWSLGISATVPISPGASITAGLNVGKNRISNNYQNTDSNSQQSMIMSSNSNNLFNVKINLNTLMNISKQSANFIESLNNCENNEFPQLLRHTILQGSHVVYEANLGEKWQTMYKFSQSMTTIDINNYFRDTLNLNFNIGLTGAVKGTLGFKQNKTKETDQKSNYLNYTNAIYYSQYKQGAINGSAQGQNCGDSGATLDAFSITEQLASPIDFQFIGNKGATNVVNFYNNIINLVKNESVIKYQSRGQPALKSGAFSLDSFASFTKISDLLDYNNIICLGDQTGTNCSEISQNNFFQNIVNNIKNGVPYLNQVPYAAPYQGNAGVGSNACYTLVKITNKSPYLFNYKSTNTMTGICWEGSLKTIVPYSTFYMVATDANADLQLEFIVEFEQGTADTITADRVSTFPKNSPQYNKVKSLLINEKGTSSVTIWPSKFKKLGQMQIYAKTFIDNGSWYGVTLNGMAAYGQQQGDTGEMTAIDPNYTIKAIQDGSQTNSANHHAQFNIVIEDFVTS